MISWLLVAVITGGWVGSCEFLLLQANFHFYSDDNNNNNYNNTILRKEQPEEDGDASYDTSKKIRMLSDEKVRLAAALGKSRHKELLLKNKNL